LEAGKAVRDRRGWQRARRVARRAIRQLLVEPGRDDLLRRERPLHRLNGERDCGGAVLRARSAAHRGSFSDCGVVGMVKVTASGSSAVALRLPEARMALRCRRVRARCMPSLPRIMAGILRRPASVRSPTLSNSRSTWPNHAAVPLRSAVKTL